MNSRSCETCEMWVRLNEAGGHCYAHPPTPYFHAAFDGLGSCDSGNLRPFTEAAEWCGEHRPRPQTIADIEASLALRPPPPDEDHWL